MIKNYELIERWNKLTEEIQENEQIYKELVKYKYDMCEQLPKEIKEIERSELRGIWLLAKAYRRRGDVNINLYLNSYVFNNYENAFKEKYLPIPLPSMPKELFQDLYEKAKCEYEKCVKISLDNNEIRNYHFLMLEQMNLLVRKE